MGDIGAKYLGLGLYKLIKLNYLYLDLRFLFWLKLRNFGIKYLGLGIS